MSWCISININEKSKEAALKLLDETVKKMKTCGNISHEKYLDDEPWLPHIMYDSYEGLGG